MNLQMSFVDNRLEDEILLHANDLPDDHPSAEHTIVIYLSPISGLKPVSSLTLSLPITDLALESPSLAPGERKVEIPS